MIHSIYNTWKCLNNKEKESSNDASKAFFIHVHLIIEATLGSFYQYLGYNISLFFKVETSNNLYWVSIKVCSDLLVCFYSLQLIFTTPK